MTVVSDIRVVSPYMTNVSESMLEAQRAVFAKFGVRLEQIPFRDIEHGDWMDDFARNCRDEIIAIADIDAFPLTIEGTDRAFKTAIDGGLFGLAQVANHKAPNHIYAGPMFMAFSSQTYAAIGRPSLRRSKAFDAAQGLSSAAEQRGVRIDLAFPNASIQPLWPLANETVFGIGTFYGGNQFFHLFQSRKARHIALLEAVADDVVNDRPLRFDAYLKIIGAAEASPKTTLLRRLLG